MPVHENLSAAMPACHAERSEASKLPPDQNTAKPPNTPSNSYAREGKPPSHSPATPHDSGAIIWPGRKSSSQEAGGHSLPVYGEGWGGAGRGAAQLTHTSTVAVSQDAGECPPSPSPARGGKKGVCHAERHPPPESCLRFTAWLGKKGGCHAERHPPACHLGYPAATWFAASSDSEPAPRTGRWDTDGPRALAPSILVPISR
jgi:hypothetical protein